MRLSTARLFKCKLNGIHIYPKCMQCATETKEKKKRMKATKAARPTDNDVGRRPTKRHTKTQRNKAAGVRFEYKKKETNCIINAILL